MNNWKQIEISTRVGQSSDLSFLVLILVVFALFIMMLGTSEEAEAQNLHHSKQELHFDRTSDPTKEQVKVSITFNNIDSIQKARVFALVDSVNEVRKNNSPMNMKKLINEFLQQSNDNVHAVLLHLAKYDPRGIYRARFLAPKADWTKYEEVSATQVSEDFEAQVFDFYHFKFPSSFSEPSHEHLIHPVSDWLQEVMPIFDMVRGHELTVTLSYQEGRFEAATLTKESKVNFNEFMKILNLPDLVYVRFNLPENKHLHFVKN